jgi:hypothetical protein
MKEPSNHNVRTGILTNSNVVRKALSHITLFKITDTSYRVSKLNNITEYLSL